MARIRVEHSLVAERDLGQPAGKPLGRVRPLCLNWHLESVGCRGMRRMQARSLGNSPAWTLSRMPRALNRKARAKRRLADGLSHFLAGLLLGFFFGGMNLNLRG